MSYIVTVLNQGEVDVVGQATNMTNLVKVLTNLSNFASTQYPDHEVSRELPDYKELVKLFKDRANCPRISKSQYWLYDVDTGDTMSMQITYIRDNISMKF